MARYVRSFIVSEKNLHLLKRAYGSKLKCHSCKQPVKIGERAVSIHPGGARSKLFHEECWEGYRIDL